jgi:hypothetical protein
MCSLVHIPKIDDGAIFQIVKKNFKVLSAPAFLFQSEVPAMHENPLPAPVIPGEALNPDCIADRDVLANIKGFLTYHNELRGNVNEQRRQGITVNDDNIPLPKNTTPTGQVLPSKSTKSGTWKMPKACC